MRKLFLDDIRSPKDAIGLVPSHMNQFYWSNDWDVVRSHDEFVDFIEKNGVPDFVSFDHDLADEQPRSWRGAAGVPGALREPGRQAEHRVLFGEREKTSVLMLSLWEKSLYL